MLTWDTLFTGPLKRLPERFATIEIELMFEKLSLSIIFSLETCITALRCHKNGVNTDMMSFNEI